MSDKLALFYLFYFLRGDAEHCRDVRIKLDRTTQIAGLSDVPQPDESLQAPVALRMAFTQENSSDGGSGRIPASSLLIDSHCCSWI